MNAVLCSYMEAHKPIAHSSFLLSARSGRALASTGGAGDALLRRTRPIFATDRRMRDGIAQTQRVRRALALPLSMSPDGQRRPGSTFTPRCDLEKIPESWHSSSARMAMRLE
jgi:hypothetical protein